MWKICSLLVALLSQNAASIKFKSKLAVEGTCDVDVGDRVDCYLGEEDCLAAGCCWEEHTDDNEGVVPWCFQADGAQGGYVLTESSTSSSGITGILTAIDPSTDSLGADISVLALEVSVVESSVDMVRVKISDANDISRWEVPESLVPTTASSSPSSSSSTPSASSEKGDDAEDDPFENTNFDVVFTQSPFTFTVTRRSDGAVLFSSSETLVFKDQYLELGNTGLPSGGKLFGLGDVTRSSGLPIDPGTTSTLWARDMPAQVFDSNLYGSHPMYVSLSPTGDASGAFLRNSNGMDVVYSSSGEEVTFKAIGGVVDLFVFMGPTPAEVAAQYTSLVGRPAMMPYWSLGYHQCRYGYQTVEAVEAVRNNFSEASIPLDVVWMDIDYMSHWKDWTYDPVNFPEATVASFIDSVHSGGQKFVVIVDPGILALDDSWPCSDPTLGDAGDIGCPYTPYTQGMERNLFVRDGFSSGEGRDGQGNPYMAQVWPGPVHFPDWFHPNSSAYWEESIQTFWDAVPFDGLWTDMNEVSNFCNDGGFGQVCSNGDPDNCPTGVLATQTTCCLSCDQTDASDPLDYPPYAINNDNSKQALGHKTLPMSSLHFSDADGPGGEDGVFSLKEYDTHNLYGMMEAKETASALASVRGQRPFVLSRSTFPGHGSHAAHWQGDNAATWADLKAASVAVMNFNLYGIPMIGSDMCGFNGDTTEELCARWMALGAFHPFSRNHNAIGQTDQEPYQWDSVAAVTRSALGLRYRLLPYLYSAFFAAHSSGALVAQPLWAQFPSDADTHGVDEQFLLGSNVLVSPALYEGQLTVSAYFPAAAAEAEADAAPTVWFALSGGDPEGPDFVVAPDTVVLSTPLSAFNVHVQSGAVLPLHAGTNPSTGAAPLTSAEARTLPLDLVVALSDFAADATATTTATAQGSLFWDDGEQVELESNLQVAYSATPSQVAASVVEAGYADKALLYGTVTVLGLAAEPSAAKLSTGEEVPFTVSVLTGGSSAKAAKVASGDDAAAYSVEFDLSGAGLLVSEKFTLTWEN